MQSFRKQTARKRINIPVDEAVKTSRKVYKLYKILVNTFFVTTARSSQDSRQFYFDQETVGSGFKLPGRFTEASHLNI